MAISGKAPGDKKKYANCTFWMDKEEYDRVDKMCFDLDLNRSELMRKLVNEKFEEMYE